MKNTIGRKVGMTQLFLEDGTLIPVSVIQAGPVFVSQKKTVESDGYNAVQVAFETVKEKRLNKPELGHIKKAGLEPKKYLREFRVDNPDDYEIGQELTIADFEVGDFVDVIGTSKGKGTQGMIKKHGFARGRESHGSKLHRTAGGMGASAYPGRVFKGHRMMGRMGNERVTVQNLEVVRVDVENNLLMVKGGVPGPNKGVLVVRKAIKK